MGLKSSFGLLLIAAAGVFAGNAGNVTGMGLFTGVDGKKYIRVNHTVGGADFGCRTNSADKLWGTFYIPWDENEIVAVSQFSSLQKALQSTDLKVEAVSGFTAPNGPTPEWAPLVDKWYLFK